MLARQKFGSGRRAWHDRCVEWFIAVVAVAALGVAAIVAAGGLGSMAAEPTRDIFRQDLPGDRELTGEDLQRLRFGVSLRGYAMNQVDDVLDRLSGELAERDRRIAELESILTERGIAVRPAFTDAAVRGTAGAPGVDGAADTGGFGDPDVATTADDPVASTTTPGPELLR